MARCVETVLLRPTDIVVVVVVVVVAGVRGQNDAGAGEMLDATSVHVR